VRKLENQVKQLQVQSAQRDLEPKIEPTPAPKLRTEPVTDAEFKLTGAEKDDPFLGNPSADLLLMAFFDYESAASRRFARITLRTLRDEVLSKRKLKLILRDFPLPNHPGAIAAASLAQCAGEQGRYWELFDLLNSKELPFDLTATAAELKKIDKGRMDRCLRSNRYAVEVERDVADGQALGARGAPTFFLGRCTDGSCTGKFIRGAQPFGVFKRLIAELSSVDTPPAR